MLENGITLEELKGAIQDLKPGRAPGEDGFPSDFYKKFSEVLAPKLLYVLNVLVKGKLPESIRTNIITLIHKKGKDPQQCASYRPLSLGNVDGKILAKILAKRKDKLLPIIIHPDQVGFIRARSSADNMRRLLHLMWSSRNNIDPVMAFSLDTEKAFDRVEWGFLFQTLKRFGFGPLFTKWVNLLYTEPVASLLCNGVVSSRFELHRGTKQECPLSP